MAAPASISQYLQIYGNALGDRVLAHFPPLHNPDDPISPELGRLKRRPFPAQTLAIMGIAKRWRQARCAAAVAECGTGKTLISLGSVFTHARGRRFTCLAMVPPQLVEKWARECFLTLPGVRVFVIDGIRNGVGSNGFTGANEVRFRGGRIVREGLKTTLSDIRLARTSRSARARWEALVPSPSIFIVSRERAKLGYFWRHSFQVSGSGPFTGSVVNPDTGKPVTTAEDQLRRADFRKAKHSETVAAESGNSRRTFFSPLWQADRERIPRMAPIEFIGRYLGGFFDYGIADEVHELKGETAQGNALGTMASACGRTVILTGTLLGGYADEMFNILYRARRADDARKGSSTRSGRPAVRRNLRGAGEGDHDRAGGERLLEGQGFDDGEAPAGCVAAAVRQIPDESGGIRLSGRTSPMPCPRTAKRCCRLTWTRRWPRHTRISKSPLPTPFGNITAILPSSAPR